MTYEEKIEFLVADLGRFGMSYYALVPRMYHPFWLAGIKPPPPLLASFWQSALGLGLYFGLVMGAVCAAFLDIGWWFSNGEPPPLKFIFGIVAYWTLGGVPFGLINAVRYWRLRRKFKLPLWKDYPGAGRIQSLLRSEPG